jgi:hypothetical protein
MPAVSLATQETRCSLEYGRCMQWLITRHDCEHRHIALKVYYMAKHYHDKQFQRIGWAGGHGDPHPRKLQGRSVK